MHPQSAAHSARCAACGFFGIHPPTDPGRLQRQVHLHRAGLLYDNMMSDLRRGEKQRGLNVAHSDAPCTAVQAVIQKSNVCCQSSILHRVCPTCDLSLQCMAIPARAPASRFIRVVLPAPLGPTIATRLPMSCRSATDQNLHPHQSSPSESASPSTLASQQPQSPRHPRPSLVLEQ